MRRNKMAKLYMTARSDRSNGKTLTGNKYIDICLGYDETDADKYIHILINRPDDEGKIFLWVNGKKTVEVEE